MSRPGGARQADHLLDVRRVASKDPGVQFDSAMFAAENQLLNAGRYQKEAPIVTELLRLDAHSVRASAAPISARQTRSPARRRRSRDGQKPPERAGR
jgi:hypothetical protein